LGGCHFSIRSPDGRKSSDLIPIARHQGFLLASIPTFDLPFSEKRFVAAWKGVKPDKTHRTT
jgi:hypothetical protein